MNTIDQNIAVDVPAEKAYAAWSGFENFPQFMDGIERVERTGDRTLHWYANVYGKHEEWDARITEDIPGKRIAWTATDGAVHAGVVTFHRLEEGRSRVMLQMAYQPTEITEKLGHMLGLLERRVKSDLRRFKAYVEQAPDPLPLLSQPAPTPLPGSVPLPGSYRPSQTSESSS